MSFFRSTLNDVKQWIAQQGAASPLPSSHDTVVNPSERPAITQKMTGQDILAECAEEIVKKARASNVTINDGLQYLLTRVEIRVPPALHSEGRSLLVIPNHHLTDSFKHAIARKDVDCLVNTDGLTQFTLALVADPGAAVVAAADAADANELLVFYNSPKIPQTLSYRLTIALCATINDSPNGKSRAQLKAAKAGASSGNRHAKRSGEVDLVVQVQGVVTVLREFPATIGRADTCDVQILDETVSREHLVIELDHRSRHIVKNLSTHTLLNASKLPYNESAVLGAQGQMVLGAGAQVVLIYHAQQHGMSTAGASTASLPVGERTTKMMPAGWRPSSDVTMTTVKPPPTSSSKEPAQPPLRAATFVVLNQAGAIGQETVLSALPQTVAVGGMTMEFMQQASDSALLVEVRSGAIELLDQSGHVARAVGRSGPAFYRWEYGTRARLPDGSTAMLA